MAKKGKIQSQKQEQFWGRELEYVMNQGMFDSIAEDVKGDRNQFVLDYINQTFGLLGHVTTITIEGA